MCISNSIIVKSPVDRTYRIPRFFFYLGMLTIGQTVVRPALSFTISDWFFLISFFFTTSESLLRRKIEIRFPPFMFLGLFSFAIGGIISSAFAKMPLMSLIALFKYLYLIGVWFWLGTVLLQKITQIETALVLWSSSAAISGLGAILQTFWEDIIPGTAPAWNRMTGLTEHVNDLGGLTSVALIPAIMIITHLKKNIWQYAYSWICVILISGGLVLSVSLTAVSALIASAFVWVGINRFTTKNRLILIISVVLLIAAISIQSQYAGISILSRLNDISDDGLSLVSLQTRMDTYSEAWEVICNSPIFGVGLGPEIGMTDTGYVVHNIFLLNWFESGFFGFLGIFLILFAIAFSAYKGIRDPNRRRERILGTTLFSSFIAFIVLGIAHPIYYKRFGWISAALLLSLYSSRYRLEYFKNK